MLYYFKKGKNNNWNTKKKKFVQCIEKVLWLMECVRSGLINFVLEISHWMMLHGGVDQLKLIAIRSRHCLRSVNSILCRRQPTHSKYPNQALKSICASLVMLVTLMFGLHISKVKKTFLTVFPHVIVYLTIMKTFHF